MKGIKVTQDNFKYIYGRVFKFFMPNGRNKTTAMAFDLWADIKCGKNNHVPVNGNISHVFVQKVVGYIDEETNQPAAIGIHIVDIMQGNKDIYIAIGNSVAFCGNRIVLKLQFRDEYNNVQTGYMAIQVSNAITETELQKIRSSANIEFVTDDSFIEDDLGETTVDCNCGCHDFDSDADDINNYYPESNE